MLIGKTVACGDGADRVYGRILRAHANEVTLAPYEPVTSQTAYYANLLNSMSEEQTRVDNLTSQIDKLSLLLTPSTSGNAGTVELTILEWVQQRLEKMDTSYIKTACSLSKPPEPTFTVLTAVATLILNTASTPTWAATRRAVSGSNFLVALRNTAVTQLSDEVYDRVLNTFLSDHNFNALNNETANERSLTEILLLKKWVTAVMDYQRARFGINDHVEVRQQLNACQLSLAAALRRLCTVREQVRLISSAALLCLDTSKRLTRDTNAIRFVVADSALDENGKYLDCSRCLPVSARESKPPLTPSHPTSVVCETGQQSSSAHIHQLESILKELATEQQLLTNEFNNTEIQQGNLLEVTQHLLICVDDQREECVRLSRAVSSAKREVLLAKGVVSFLRSSQEACTCRVVKSIQSGNEQHMHITQEISRLAASTDELLRGLCAISCL